VIELVNSGQVSEARIDESVRRILRDKFRLGLFDNPYVDVEHAKHVVGNPAFRAAGNIAQRKSIVLLKNADDVLPLSGRPKLYIEGIAPEIATQYGDVVDTVEEADFAILRLKTPFEPREQFFLETFFHAGSLAFSEEENARILAICDAVPTIVDIYLERAAVIPDIAEHAVGLTANFGASADAILDIIFGRFHPTAKLPFELPSSMEAATTQRSDVPSDSDNPLFTYGFGLTY
jgi:beta-glucosidase